MVPTKTVEDAGLAKAYRQLVAASPISSRTLESITLTELELPFWKGMRVVLATGWSEGGHWRPMPRLFTVNAEGPRVLLPMAENLDKPGYRRRVTELRSCTVDEVLTLLNDFMNAPPCTQVLSTLADAPPGAVAALLATALEGAVPNTDVTSAGLKALLAGKSAPNTKWTLPAAKPEKWTVEGGRAHGMLEGGDDHQVLLRVTVEVEKGSLRYTQESLAFEQRFIE